MIKVREMREGVQASAPPCYFGEVKVCKDENIIAGVVGEANFIDYHTEALKAIYPDDEAAQLFESLCPVLVFSTKGRATLYFYNTLEVESLADDADVNMRSWNKVLPDKERLFATAKHLMKWN